MISQFSSLPKCVQTYPNEKLEMVGPVELRREQMFGSKRSGKGLQIVSPREQLHSRLRSHLENDSNPCPVSDSHNIRAAAVAIADRNMGIAETPMHALVPHRLIDPDKCRTGSLSGLCSLTLNIPHSPACILSRLMIDNIQNPDVNIFNGNICCRLTITHSVRV